MSKLLGNDPSIADDWTGDFYEVAMLAKQTGRTAVEIRRAILKVGPKRELVIAELEKSAGAGE